MSHGTLKYKLAPFGKAVLGKGSYCIAYRATEEGSGRTVALKKSRMSRTVKRPYLRHEARIIQCLKGYPTIPDVYGYGHLEHFEYLAMECLGPSIAEQQQDGAGVSVKTTIRIVVQALAALQHVHSCGFIHRDIKPDNFLCALDDPSIIKLIDFGISKPFSPSTPGLAKYDPLKDRRHIVGSLYWASLNSHNGEDLAPRDDLESLALIALYLLRGNLPWKPRPHTESQLRSQEIVRIMKSACSSSELSTGFPSEFSDLLTYSRSLAYDQIPDYKLLKASFVDLANRMGYSFNDGPLDWTPRHPEITNPMLEEPKVEISDEDKDEEGNDEDDLGEDSYFGLDIDIWSRQGERDKDLTLPAEQEVELDNNIPEIEQVEDDWGLSG